MEHIQYTSTTRVGFLGDQLVEAIVGDEGHHSGRHTMAGAIDGGDVQSITHALHVWQIPAYRGQGLVIQEAIRHDGLQLRLIGHDGRLYRLSVTQAALDVVVLRLQLGIECLNGPFLGDDGELLLALYRPSPGHIDGQTQHGDGTEQAVPFHGAFRTPLKFKDLCLRLRSLVLLLEQFHITLALLALHAHAIHAHGL